MERSNAVRMDVGWWWSDKIYIRKRGMVRLLWTLEKIPQELSHL